MLIFYWKCLSIWMQGVDCIPWTVEKSLSSICRKCAAWGQGHRNVSRNLYLSPTVLNFTIRYETLCIVQINTYFALKLFCFEIHNKVPVYYAITNEKINFTDLVVSCTLYLENTAKLVFCFFFSPKHTPFVTVLLEELLVKSLLQQVSLSLAVGQCCFHLHHVNIACY